MSTDRPRVTDGEQGIPTPRPWGYFATAGWLVLATLISTILFVGVVKWLDPEAQLKPGVADNELRLLPYVTTVWNGALLGRGPQANARSSRRCHRTALLVITASIARSALRRERLHLVPHPH